MSILKELGIVAGEDNKASTLFEKIFPHFLDVTYNKPSEYVKKYWDEYEKNFGGKDGNNNMNGKVYEYILATLLIREGIFPLFIGAKVAFVPNVDYDILLYTSEKGPICISAKTSLRERYKQADLESIALKYVHRKSLCFLITNAENEAKNVKEKIKKGDVIGLDNVLYAFGSDFDKLIADLKEFTYSSPGPVEVITTSFVVTADKINKVIADKSI